MSATVWWDINSENVPSAEELEAFIFVTLNMVNPQGTRAFTMWIGPLGARRADAPLRLDLDPDPGQAPVATIDAIADLPEIAPGTVVGAAAARWLPDGLVAVDPNFRGQDIRVMESSYGDLVDVPAQVARVSVAAAIAIAREYCESNSRPDGMTGIGSFLWQSTQAQ